LINLFILFGQNRSFYQLVNCVFKAVLLRTRGHWLFYFWFRLFFFDRLYGSLSLVEFRYINWLEELMTTLSIIRPLAIRKGVNVSLEEVLAFLLIGLRVKAIVIPMQANALSSFDIFNLYNCAELILYLQFLGNMNYSDRLFCKTLCLYFLSLLYVILTGLRCF
jgi:hypothetical protein